MSMDQPVKLGPKRIFLAIGRRIWPIARTRIEQRLADIEQRLADIKQRLADSEQRHADSGHIEKRLEQQQAEIEKRLAEIEPNLPAFLNAVTTIRAFGFELQQQRDILKRQETRISDGG